MAKKRYIYVWRCCACGSSGIRLQDPSCLHCGTARCGNCQTTKVQSQNLGTSGYPTDDKHTLSRITNPHRHYEHWIPAYINGIKVTAFPDNCSALNIVSEDFTNRNKLIIDRTKLTTIHLPNGDTKKSSGSLKSKFRFNREKTLFDLVFTVLPNCVCSVVLSSDFLRVTKTFTTYKSRIQRGRTLSRLRPRVCLQGSPKQQVLGSINGHSVSASPDTGSDVNVISKGYAESIQLKIDTNPNAMETIVFIDGSTTTTCGIVYDVEWKFGSAPTRAASALQARGISQKLAKNVLDWEYGSDARRNSAFICNFYVLENLCCPIILNADLLYGTNAFTACAEHFHDNEGVSLIEELESADVCVMKKTPKRWGIFSRTKTSNCRPQNTPISSRPEVNEAQMRMHELDRINALPLHKQAAAHEAERLRQRQWALNNSTQNSQTGPQQPALQSTLPQAASGPNAQITSS
ncbi:hypothetical protein BKA66DRAFT_566602 [Pyrenochaeta sp. MPI-SDFR-AT-0127]|nr:hypothetical protein BKA66DRAFT_566602 [Pyrenochaeta sp. MPI-SDFR-AT-0127]